MKTRASGRGQGLDWGLDKKECDEGRRVGGAREGRGL